ncbi:hyaluronan and proteoglycan link protein 1-like [Petromyzon marinus]|uniref:hyaluronan and proteoglycan link protein 1-like n=1 Tax=Petromyzon marinus TaxID=7757 RepID=UPI003F71BD3C
MWTKASYIDRAKWTSYKVQIASFNSSTHVHSHYRGRAWIYGDNSSNFSLSIEALTADDAGYYKVTAVWDSDDGELRSESQQFLAVHEGCEVYTPRDSLRCTPGETVTLPCQAYSPLCALDTITWFKVTSEKLPIVRSMKTGNNHTEAGYKGRVHLAALGAHDASLILTDVTLNDSGIYECQHRWGHENKIHSSKATVTLAVQHELMPKPRGKDDS